MDPLPGLPPDLWDRMAAYLRGIDASLGHRPAAILVISGHWETAEPTVNTALRPPLLFDYSGFPEHTYHLTYPVGGSPAIDADATLIDAQTQAFDAPTQAISNPPPPGRHRPR